jgi:transcription elongation factor GreA
MKSFKMQKETYDRLQKEKKELEEKIIHVTKEVEIARERGDLRENAEYSAARASEAQLKFTLGQITEKLRNAMVIDITTIENKDFITFGCTVFLFDKTLNKETIYTILGEEEANITERKISCDSPLGQNLLGKKINEEFSFQTPGGLKTFIVKNFFITK